MIIETRPFNLACIADEASFEEAITKYTETYVETSTGWMCHKRLDANRYVRFAVKGPAMSTASPKKYEMKNNFFPAGKVPYLLLEQIVQFYRDVIGKIGSSSSLEARADIVWNAETGYRVAIPTQTVSGAHLNYSNDHLQPGDIIIVDTHSHGSSMGAFFSGTDDKDDNSTVRFSGVIGKITTNSFESVWRFNNGPGVAKDKADIVQIFDRVADKIDYPTDWLAKVEKPASSFGIGGTHYGYGYGGKGFGGLNAQRPSTAVSPFTSGGANKRHISAAEWYRNLEETPSGMGSGSNLPERSHRQKDLLDYTDAEIMARCGLDSDLPVLVGGPASEKKPVIHGELSLEEFEREIGLVVDDHDTRAEQRELELYNAICDKVNDLHDDESLLKVIREAYDCLSPKSQARLQQNGL